MSRSRSRLSGSDGLKKRHRSTSLRQKTRKKPGGQEGHSGTTLRQVENPDRIQIHRVDRCGHCHSSLAKVPAAQHEKRQVFDLPPRLIEVTEHQAEIKICLYCQESTRAAFPKEVTHQAEYGLRMKAIGLYLINQQLLPYERTAELFRDLLERLHTHAREILAFAHDLKKSFDKNQAERDLRMMKVQQKISGTFRSVEGARAFCRIRGIISTRRKQNLNVLNAIESLLLDKPVVGLA
ncbi:MAG: IS66 family transposase [bacterium]